ncbi:type II secretion system secretin GspD [Candidatus Litorirhabdus singularis]|uniref:type II secretion system secretin GspD n=1 Tax=Candidatus Litorirhabdus singularis TaxID=2518993 RepID=UPI00242A5DE2|nr:type II secretion system secretin GspD [Candidatus Litorirhabdus singularis]
MNRSKAGFSGLLSNTGIGLLQALLLVLLGVGAASAQDWTVNLKETDIQELIKFVSEATDTTIVVDPKVKGKVKVVSSRPVSKSELYDLFLSILDVHGYTAVRSGNVVRVIPSKDARSAPVPVQDGVLKQNDEYVTQVIRLENISAAKLIPVLRPLVPQQAHMAAYAPSNAIIISDIAANIERIRSIIERMDQGAVQQTEIMPLEFAVADDVVRMLEELNKTTAKKSGAPEDEVLLVADKRTNSVLISGDELERARMRKLIKHLDTPLEQSGNVKVVYLEYAMAEDIAMVLTKVMQNIGKLEASDKAKRTSGNNATIEADAGTNALIITANTDQMQSIEAVIRRLDIRRAQVLVEAIIAEMELIDGQDLGIQWLFRSDNGAFGSNVVDGSNRAQGIADGLFPPENLPEDGGDFDRGGLLSALAGTPGTTLGWGQLDDALDFAVILNALKSESNANILSTPSLLTLDNQEAYITVGQEVPFVTGSFTGTGGSNTPNNPFQTIQRENVGITLTVTPHVNEGDSVVLDIEQEVSSLTGALSLLASDIITNERKIQTKVLAGDGRTVVLGGLIKDDVQDATQKVPLLGDIPWLGRLFRSDSVSVTRSNLLIFIKPTIIRDEAALEGATAAKYSYIRGQQQMRIDSGIEFLDESEIPILPEWESQIQQLEEMSTSADEPAAAEGP